MKQQARIRKYSDHKKKLFTGDDICAIALLQNKSALIIEKFKDCQYRATEFHHPAGRLGQEMFTDNGKKLCNNCHRIIETSPVLAKSLGLSTSRLTKQK